MTRVIGSLAARVGLSEQGAVGTHWLSVLLQHVRVEELALEWRVVQELVDHLHPPGDEGKILGVLGSSVTGADSGVVWTGEEGLSQAGVWVRVTLVSTTALLRWLPAWLWCGSDGLGVSVGAGDDDLEISAHLAGVGGRFSSDARAPESTLVVGNRGWVRACIRWIHVRITLNVNVETCAEGGAVAEGTTLSNIVGGEGGESEVGNSSYCSVEINEGLSIAGGSGGILGISVELRVSEESSNIIWLNLWSVTIWLNCTCFADIWGGVWYSSGRRSRNAVLGCS